MIQILLCDDEQKSLTFLTSIIDKYCSKYKCYIQAFTSTSEAQSAALKCDVCILDIDFPLANGIELAEKIKEINKDVLILFYSCKDHLVFDSFKVHPYDFIRKSESEEIVGDKLNHAFDYAMQNKLHYLFTKGSETVVIPYREILYFYKSINDLTIRTANTEYTHRKSLRSLVFPQYFHKVSASLVVNLKFIKSFDDSSIYLSNHQHFKIGKQKMREFRKHYFQYISTH